MDRDIRRSNGMLRRTEMPGAVMIRNKYEAVRQQVLQNVNNNRRSTRLIPYITKY